MGQANPVIPELINQICFTTMGNDLTVKMAATAGQLQLNAYGPAIATSILESQMILTTGMATLREKCVIGITPNEEILVQNIERSVGIATVLIPVLGYEKTAELAEEALESNKGILEIIRAKKLLTEKQIEEILNPVSVTGQK